jgi:H+-translocating NAD(P) transhydrogenase subunit alpha
MEFQTSLAALVGLMVLLLAACIALGAMARMPSMLYPSLVAGTNFMYGVVVVGGLSMLLNAGTLQEQVIGFFAVLLGAGSTAGSYMVTTRMLAVYEPRRSLHRPTSVAVPGRVRELPWLH